MKKILYSVVIIFSLFSLSCQKEAELADVALADIKISVTANQTPGLKSAGMAREINYGDTVDIQQMQEVNLLFSATVGGLPVNGRWMIYLDDADNDTEDYKVGNRPYAEASNSSICGLKPKKLGLYSVNFYHPDSGNSFFFLVRHKGIPGNIGDDQRNDYSFRLEKEVFNLSDGQLKNGYTLYLRYRPEDFYSWRETDGINPNDPSYFKAVLISGRENYFNDGCHGLNIGSMFKLKVCKYSDYVCFTFFTDEYPPSSGPSGYHVRFYSGNLGCSTWAFPATAKSDWSTEGAFIFSVIN